MADPAVNENIPTEPVAASVAAPPASVPPVEESPPAQEPAVGEAEQFESIREAASGFDYDLSSYDSDESALRHLVDRSKEFDRQAETIRQYEQVLQQQASVLDKQPAAQPAPTETTPPEWQWSPPPYQAMWLNQA